MKEIKQLILDFKLNKNYSKDDFFVSDKHFDINLLESWQSGKNVVNICGERYSGKTHLSKYFLEKVNLLFWRKKFQFNDNNKLRFYENIILDNFEEKVDEKSIFSLINFVDQQINTY